MLQVFVNIGLGIATAVSAYHINQINKRHDYIDKCEYECRSKVQTALESYHLFKKPYRFQYYDLALFQKHFNAINAQKYDNAFTYTVLNDSELIFLNTKSSADQ